VVDFLFGPFYVVLASSQHGVDYSFILNITKIFLVHFAKLKTHQL